MGELLQMHFPVNFYSVGQFTTSDGKWVHPMRTLSSSVLIVPICGTVYLEESGIKYEVSTGSAIILPACRMHRGWKSSGEMTKYYFMHFEPRAEDGEDEAMIPLFWEDISVEQVAAMMHMLIQYDSQQGVDQSILDFQTSLILMTRGMNMSEMSNGQTNGRFTRTCEWLKLNACRNITVADVAREFGYNPDYLSRLFQAHMGISIKKYIMNCRLSVAKQKLLLTDMTVREIAQNVGFCDDKYFTRVFRETENVTPGQYRKMNSDRHRCEI